MDSSKDQKNNEACTVDLLPASCAATNTTQGEKQFSIQPIKDKVEPELAAHKAHGPAIVQNLPGQEGTKEDREERKTELNK